MSKYMYVATTATTPTITTTTATTTTIITTTATTIRHINFL